MSSGFVIFCFLFSREAAKTRRKEGFGEVVRRKAAGGRSTRALESERALEGESPSLAELPASN